MEMNKRQVYKCKTCQKETNAPLGTEREKKMLCKDCFGKRKDKRKNQLNGLTGSEWAKKSISVKEYPDVRSEKQRIHGASFPKSLAKEHIEIYTKQGDVVLDPFLGVGTTVDACLELGRNSVGIELNQEFITLAQEDLTELDKLSAKIFHGDSRNLTKFVDEESIDFILTSPPYANLLQNINGAFAHKWREHSDLDPITNARPYSKNESDIGNMSYNESLLSIRKVMEECFIVQKFETYAVWVVKDFRSLKESVPYVNFHGDVIRAAEDVGYYLWDIRIYDQTKFRPLVVLGYPSRNYYMNIGHSYILVFKKTNKLPKR
ncbi:DNA methylase [Fictibacillus solisalsi]|uniref:Methyltransferase n=1 Tax=Fictibacillus solisalsi TaxID=459525 RepID=A0A1H0BZQ8_9BACL|nr:DNA methyltransferase [Fictibacillus solisalsi]SDN51124.1 DNA methylase [Fictibacillus solisalsi]